jgi:uncharacterized protein YacL
MPRRYSGVALPDVLPGRATNGMGKKQTVSELEDLLVQGAPPSPLPRTHAIRAEFQVAQPQEPSQDGAHQPREGRWRGNGRGLLVESVRLVVVALFAVFGWEVAYLFGPSPRQHLAGILLGSAIGYVLGGVFGRQTETAVRHFERELKRVPAEDILAGGIGMILGLVLATLASLPLFHLPATVAYPAVAFTYVVAGFVCYRVGRSKSNELFAMFGVKPRAAGTRPGEVAILDSSAILDGRILPLIQMGFLGGSLLVTRSVLGELHAVADSSNGSRRARGRRGLDLLVALNRDPTVDMVLVEDEEIVHGEAVDVQLVRLAKARGATLVTNDGNLGKVAAALDVPVRSIHALAEALRPEVVAGDHVQVQLTRRGRESGQAVGYLEDGTMVVVEEADHLLGDTVSATVTNALQTSTGRLIFARVSGDLQA